MQIAILLEAWCKTAPCEVYPDALDSFAGVNSSWHHSALSADWGWALRQTAAGTQAYILLNARLINELISAKKSVLSIKQSLLSMTGKAQRTRPGCFFYGMDILLMDEWTIQNGVSKSSPPGPDSSRVFYPTGRQRF